MSDLLYMVWLAKGSLGLWWYCWPITLVLALAVVAASIFNLPFRRSEFRRRHLLVFVPLAVSVLIIVWGALFRHTDRSSLAPQWPGQVVLGLLAAQLVCAIVVVSVLRGYRWFSASVVMLEQWLGIAFAFVAGMSVTGDWL